MNMRKRVSQSEVYWMKDKDQLRVYPQLDQALSADVLIIGGGFTGASTALHLAEMGQPSVLIESAHVGFGASGRTNGQVIPVLTAVEPDQLEARFGKQGRSYAEMIGNSSSYLFDLAKRHDIDCEAEQSGWAQPAHSPGRIDLSRRRVETWKNYGLEMELLDRDQMAQLVGSDHWYGGMLAREGGHINPFRLVQGLTAKANDLGALVFENTPAQSIRRVGEHWEVQTPKAKITAKKIVLATMAYTDYFSKAIAKPMRNSFVPIRCWQMVTAPLTKQQQEQVVPGRQSISDTRGDLVFFRYDKENRLVSGGILMLPFNARERMHRSVRKKIEMVFPSLAPVEFTHSWLGDMSINKERTPYFHQLEENFWSWSGCNGRGVGLSISMGRELAKAAYGVPLSELEVPETKPQPMKLRGLKSKIAPAMLSVFRYKDRQEMAL